MPGGVAPARGPPALAAITAATAGAHQSNQSDGGAVTGPTTNVKPYVIPVADGVTTVSMLTVGDKFPALTVPVQQGSALPAGATLDVNGASYVR